jgi:hypothetical protein
MLIESGIEPQRSPALDRRKGDGAMRPELNTVVAALVAAGDPRPKVNPDGPDRWQIFSWVRGPVASQDDLDALCAQMAPARAAALAKQAADEALRARSAAQEAEADRIRRSRPAMQDWGVVVHTPTTSQWSGVGPVPSELVAQRDGSWRVPAGCSVEWSTSWGGRIFHRVAVLPGEIVRVSGRFGRTGSGRSRQRLIVHMPWSMCDRA